MQKKLWKVKLTICISDLDLVLKSSSHSNAKNHKYPIDVRDVNLPKEFFWGVHNTDTGKTAQRKSLLYNRVGSRYGGLTCNYCCKSCNDEGWPIYGICSDQSSYHEYIIVHTALVNRKNGGICTMSICTSWTWCIDNVSWHKMVIFLWVPGMER